MNTLRIPIYPSSGVLFPGEVQVFSTEHDDLRHMLDYAYEQHVPLGLVHTTASHSAGLALTGTTAVLLDSGEVRVNEGEALLLVGQERFQMLQIHQDKPFLEATVQTWPWDPKPRPAWNLVELVGDYLRRYTEALNDILPPAILPESLVRQTAALGILAAGLMQLPCNEKQLLLETRTSEHLLAAVILHLRVQVPIAERLSEMQPFHSCCERIFLN